MPRQTTKIILPAELDPNPKPVNKVNYQNYRKLYNKLIRLSKKLYYESKLLENQSNPKKTWQFFNEIIGRKSV